MPTFNSGHKLPNAKVAEKQRLYLYNNKERKKKKIGGKNGQVKIYDQRRLELLPAIFINTLPLPFIYFCETWLSVVWGVYKLGILGGMFISSK